MERNECGKYGSVGAEGLRTRKSGIMMFSFGVEKSRRRCKMPFLVGWNLEMRVFSGDWLLGRNKGGLPHVIVMLTPSKGGVGRLQGTYGRVVQRESS